MARTDNLNNYLTDVATAIKNKKGDQTPINAANFDTEITNLPSGGEINIDKNVCFAFTGYNKNISVDWSFFSNIDFGDRTDFSNLFKYAEALTTIPNNTKFLNGIKYSETFAYTNIETANLTLPNATSINYAFSLCPELTSATINVPKCKQFAAAFQQSTKLVTVNISSTGERTDVNCETMFTNCSLLTNVTLSITNIINAKSMFQNCNLLVTAPSLDLSRTAKLQYMFSGCTSLENIPEYNLSSLTNIKMLSGMVNNCPSLTNESLHNLIKTLLTIPSMASVYKTLKYIGMSSTQASTCTTFTEWATLQADGWTTGY